MGIILHLLISGFLLLHHLITAQNEYADVTVSECIDQPIKWLMANCSVGHMVEIKQVIYGYSATGHCGYTDGDCTLADPEIYHCVGRKECKLNLPSGTRGRTIPTCGQDSTYMQITYSCIPVAVTTDICQENVINTERGYITTPRYPNNYPSSHDCQLEIQAHKSQFIRLFIIDLDLGNESNGSCFDWLYIQSTLKSSTMCGRRGSEQIFKTFKGSALTLSFESNEHGSNKGFWLYYEAYPPLPSTTTEASTTGLPVTTLSRRHDRTDPSPTQAWHAEKRPTSPWPSQYRGHTQNHNYVPMEAIIGAVMGTLILFLLLLLVLLIIKRRKERDMMSSSMSTCHLHGKGGPGSPMHGTAGPYIQNNLDQSMDHVL